MGVSLRSGPGRCLQQRGVLEPVEGETADLAATDDAAVTEHAELLADGRLLESQQQTQIEDTELLGTGERVEHAQPRGRHEQLECRGQ